VFPSTGQFLSLSTSALREIEMKKHPVEIAVAPVKADAIAAAEQRARETVERHRAGLEAAGWNQNIWAPYPDHRSADYHQANAKYRTCSCLVSWLEVTSRRNEPLIVQMDEGKIARFIENAKTLAAEQYDMFIMKLVRKIGDCESAMLEGNHVWGSSVLTVFKLPGITERWKTQQIVNYSKLGLAFPQWPSRKVK
jgi:hypothetical protein